MTRASFRQFNYLIISLLKLLSLRNFCQKGVKVTFRLLWRAHCGKNKNSKNISWNQFTSWFNSLDFETLISRKLCVKRATLKSTIFHTEKFVLIEYYLAWLYSMIILLNTIYLPDRNKKLLIFFERKHEAVYKTFPRKLYDHRWKLLPSTLFQANRQNLRIRIFRATNLSNFQIL